MNVNTLLNNIVSTNTTLAKALVEHQLIDGGIKGYHNFDTQSGIWTTCETLHILLKTNNASINENWTLKAADYVDVNQNMDGGWGFRSSGKSIVDVTSWACLSLIHFDDRFKVQIMNGVKYLLSAQANISGEDHGGWGLTNFEPDRIYSTCIAVNCLTKVLATHKNWFSSEMETKIKCSISKANNWIISSKHVLNGWGPLANSTPTLVSSSIALINIFSHGQDPRNYKDVFEFIYTSCTKSLWQVEREVVITQEGYELTQEWFTSIYCFRALVFYSELGICSLEKLHGAYIALLTLIENDKVKPSADSTTELVWPIPLLIEALDKFYHFVNSKKKEYDDFLYQKELEDKIRKKTEMETLLKSSFPYPISQVYFSFTHEIDYHRRFQYLVQLNEVLIKYTAIVLLSNSIASNEKILKLKQLIEKRFKKPSLGDFTSIVEIILNESLKVEGIIFPNTVNNLKQKRVNYLDYDLPKSNLSQAFSEIIALRNTWTGHGAVRSVYEYKLEVDNQLPNSLTMLDRFRFLADCHSFLILSSDFNEFGDGDVYKIRLFNGLEILDNDLEIQKRLSEGHRDQMIRYVYFHNLKSNSVVNLYPFISHMFCIDCKKERFFFYNGIKNTKVSYLSYECGHDLENDNLGHFIKRFNAIDVQFS